MLAVLLTLRWQRTFVLALLLLLLAVLMLTQNRHTPHLSVI
jgi:HAMP domain-containing protein